MKKFIILILLLLITTVCYASKPLTITIENQSTGVVFVTIDSIDHDFRVDGKLYPYNVTVCGAEMQPGSEFVLSPRDHNKPPHRYLLTIHRRVDNSWKITQMTTFKIKPYLIKTNILIYDKVIKIFSYSKNYNNNIGENDD
jgi:hypothetical protein